MLGALPPDSRRADPDFPTWNHSFRAPFDPSDIVPSTRTKLTQLRSPKLVDRAWTARAWRALISFKVTERTVKTDNGQSLIDYPLYALNKPLILLINPSNHSRTTRGMRSIFNLSSLFQSNETVFPTSLRPTFRRLETSVQSWGHL